MTEGNEKRNGSAHLGPNVSRRGAIQLAVGSVAAGILSAAAGPAAGTGPLAAQEALADPYLSWSDWASLWDTQSAAKKGSGLIGRSYWGDNTLANPTIDCFMHKDYIAADAKGAGYNHATNWSMLEDYSRCFGIAPAIASPFTFGETGPEFQSVWFCRLEAGDCVKVSYPRVGTYYGDPIGCHLTIENLPTDSDRQFGGTDGNCDRYNNWGGAAGVAADNPGGCFLKWLGFKRFIVVPKHLHSYGWWMLGVSKALFTFRFFYEGDEGNHIDVDRAYMYFDSLDQDGWIEENGNKVKDSEGQEWACPQAGFEAGGYFVQKKDTRMKCLKEDTLMNPRHQVLMPRGAVYGSDGYSTNDPVTLSFTPGANEGIGVWIGDTVGEMGWITRFAPLAADVELTLNKHLWNGAGEGAPEIPNGVYKIFAYSADHGRLFLDAPYARRANGRALQVHPATAETDNKAQTWVVTNNADGTIKISPVGNLLLAVSGKTNSPSSGDRVVQRECNLTSGENPLPYKAQRWTVAASAASNRRSTDLSTWLTGHRLRLADAASLAETLYLCADSLDKGTAGSPVKLKKKGSIDESRLAWFFDPVDADGNSMAAEVAQWVEDGEEAPAAEGPSFYYSMECESDDDESDCGLPAQSKAAGEAWSLKLGHLVDVTEDRAPETHRLDGRKYQVCPGGQGASALDVTDYPRKFEAELVKRAAQASDEVPAGVYEIRSGRGAYLGLSSGTGAGRTLIGTSDASKAEKWAVAGAGDGTYRLSPLTAAGYDVHVKDKPAKGGGVHIWPGDNATNAHWTIRDVDGHCVDIMLAGYYLSAAAGKDASLAAEECVWELLPVGYADMDDYRAHLPQTASRDLKGTEYGVFTDAACTERLRTYTLAADTAPSAEGASLGTFRGWCGKRYYVKETAAAEGYMRDETVHELYRPADDEKPTTALTVPLADVPRTSATVRFHLVDGEAASDAGSYTVEGSIKVSASDEAFKAAEGEIDIKGFYGLETDAYVKKWLEATAETFKDIDWSGDAFSSKDLAPGEDGVIDLYAMCPTGTVRYYADGTGDAALVAEEGPVRLGARYALSADATAKAARENCTPGFSGWFTSSTDKAVTEQQPGSGGESKASESWVMEKALYELYGVNRATLSFGYTTDSEQIRSGVRYRDDADASSMPARPWLPSAYVRKVAKLFSLPVMHRCYEPQDDGTWKKLEPTFWFADEAGAGTTSRTATLSGDSTRYIKWQPAAREGVAGEWAQGA